MIDLCFHVFKYQYRLLWAISSLKQQVNNPFHLNIKIAASESDPFKHLFDELDVPIEYYPDHIFNYRGQIRSLNLKNCKSNYILFLDADNVFHPNFFNNLSKKSLKTNKIISVPRLTMSPENGYELIDSEKEYKIIDNAYQKASKIKTKYSCNGRVSAAGYFQLVNMESIKKLNIDSYSSKLNDTPLTTTSKYSTKSDITFRKKFTGIEAITDLPPLIHINHYRRENSGYNNIICH